MLFPEFAGPERWLPLLQRHWQLIEAAAPRVRVTSVPAGEAVRRHYAECVELWRLAESDAFNGPLVDIGSGGGWPGLVVAILEPDREVHLVEPLKKRARLLEELRDALELGNVAVHAERAEEAGHGPLRERAGLVTARAVAELAVLLEYAAPFARIGGTLVFPRGSGARETDRATIAGGVAGTTGCAFVNATPMRAAISENLAVLRFVKVAATPELLPRRPGVPTRKPLNGSGA